MAVINIDIEIKQICLFIYPISGYQAALPDMLAMKEMHELDSLTWHVMDGMADDWESIEQIKPHVAKFHGIASDAEILKALKTLHEQQLLNLMDEDGNETSKYPEDATKHWFFMTNEGRTLWNSVGGKHRDY